MNHNEIVVKIMNMLCVWRAEVWKNHAVLITCSFN